MNHFEQLHPVVQAFLATLFTWALTALGAASVFLTKTISRRLLDFMLAFAGGVMIAASFWSLLAPGIEMAQLQGQTAWIPAAVGFLLGGAFLRLMDRFLPHLHLGYPMSEAEGVHTRWRRTTLLVMAITLHNIPEGLAVGVAFGALRYGLSSASFTAACALAMGIGLQNLPEGMAVSVPIRQMGTSRLKSFWYGQLSGMVEPIAGLIGAAAVVLVSPILPYAMGFAAGAMIYVVVEEVIPESQRAGNTDLATVGTMVGFAVMMTLDVALG
ncbi:MAG TPA: ZIP family metal transporter [Anaerohalosphaeraceae bacterium]|nr:ZIP family metal transporter [Anaerohalosphaeraceae bacterium]HPC64574.1 ZIP family metal transporter [Anaerohalosphaeraceae bacterium]HRS71633.1 ZIP family metal transporter [Anaerohalosphaeraceae bacterium]